MWLPLFPILDVKSNKESDFSKFEFVPFVVHL